MQRRRGISRGHTDTTTCTLRGNRAHRASCYSVERTVFNGVRSPRPTETHFRRMRRGMNAGMRENVLLRLYARSRTGIAGFAAGAAVVAHPAIERIAAAAIGIADTR